MSQEIQISFPDLETTATVRLLTDEAPDAAEMLWGMLQTPLTTRAVHAIYAGPAVLVEIPERHGEPRGGQIPIENETQHPEPGDILLLPAADDPAEDLWGEPGDSGGVTIAIFYGDGGRPFWPSGNQPGALVAKVTEGLAALRVTCRAARFEGAQRVTIAREGASAPTEEVIIHSDGASLGNPGPAGAGFVIEAPDGRVLAEGSNPMPPSTVNVAEYQALIDGLEKARELGAKHVRMLMDSELIVRQLSGRYRVKSEGLRPLFKRASALIATFERFECRHVPREQNARADALAGEAAKRSKERHRKHAR